MLLVELTVGLILTVLAALISGTVAAYSMLLGGLICLLPHCYFAYRAFKFQGARAARQIVRSFYTGEAVKLVLTAAMFTVVFVAVKPLNAAVLFVGFIVVQLSSWLVPIMHSSFRNE